MKVDLLQIYKIIKKALSYLKLLLKKLDTRGKLRLQWMLQLLVNTLI